MIERFANCVKTHTSVNVFKIDAAAVSNGIATAGSVPETKSRMISAPSAPISVSPRIDGPWFASFDAAAWSGSRPVTCTVTPAGAAATSAARGGLSAVDEPKPGVPTGKISAKVVWRSLETYASLCVENHELDRAPGLAATAAVIAFATPGVFVTSPLAVATTIRGAFSPLPNSLSIRWFASYAEKPGIEKDSNHLICPAANTPNTVSASQATTTMRRCR